MGGVKGLLLPFSPLRPSLAPIYLFIYLWHFGVRIVWVPDSVALSWRYFGIWILTFCTCALDRHLG